MDFLDWFKKKSKSEIMAFTFLPPNILDPEKNPGFPADFQPNLGNQGRPLILSVKIRIGFATCHGSAIIFFCKTKNSVEPRIWAISTPTRYAILYELPETNEIYNKQQCNRNRVI